MHIEIDPMAKAHPDEYRIQSRAYYTTHTCSSLGFEYKQACLGNS